MSSSGSASGSGLWNARLWRSRPDRTSAGRWMDFISDALSAGREFRSLNIVDDFHREYLVAEVDTAITGARVVRVLERLRGFRGLLQILVMNKGPEFAGQALDVWAYEHGVRLPFIEPGKPRQDALIESFNGTENGGRSNRTCASFTETSRNGNCVTTGQRGLRADRRHPPQPTRRLRPPQFPLQPQSPV